MTTTKIQAVLSLHEALQNCPQYVLHLPCNDCISVTWYSLYRDVSDKVTDYESHHRIILKIWILHVSTISGSVFVHVLMYVLVLP